MRFTASDIKQLHRRGLSVEEAERQLSQLSAAERHVRLERPCTVGDGVMQLDQPRIAVLHGLHDAAARAGRLLKFVPASGAASRMFASLMRYREGDAAVSDWPTVVERAGAGEGDAAELVAFIEQLPHLALYEELKERMQAAGADLDRLAADGRYGPILETLLGQEGMRSAERPKGLLGFHRAEPGGRTAFEEHMAEAADYARDADGRCRLHLTVAPGARRQFESVAERQAAAARQDGTRFEISYSVQKPSTDTLALDPAADPLRDAQGQLVFRPGGHGALIENLAELGADLVYVKNIDNVQPARTRPLTTHWKRALGGYLVQLQREMFRLLDALCEQDPSATSIDEAIEFARGSLQWSGRATDGPLGYQSNRALMIALLNRPLRVCGVVRNTGEPGGGPFWVRDRRGMLSKQIVETSQVDGASADQQAILLGATHFNPVDLVCGLRDHKSQPFDLTRFVDHEAVIVTRKTEAGQQVRVLERPGLWNGAMADWNTVFVEVPIETFTPVKTISDLLRPEHRA